MITSGSCRMMYFSALAKPRPCSLSDATWLMPGKRYSTGSSTVTMLRLTELSFDSSAYIVVDLAGARRAGDDDHAVRLVDQRLDRL